MRTKAGIERAVVDVLRRLGFLEGAPKGRPPLRNSIEGDTMRLYFELPCREFSLPRSGRIYGEGPWWPSAARVAAPITCATRWP